MIFIEDLKTYNITALLCYIVGEKIGKALDVGKNFLIAVLGKLE
ncbi:hypothetical protein [Clostridium estertheticum]|nr:hypothetical protein [Clostridium estertheticum]